MNGILNFFKPKGMTSHDVVNICRGIFNTRRVGHGGTLDPNVTGVLPILIGKATRVSQYLLESDKEYIGELTLGSSTDTQDTDGEVVAYSDIIVTEDEIIRAFEEFTGPISQVPPMYSALKHKGKKLYDLAREGKVVERKPRESIIYQLDIKNNTDNRKIEFYTKCSKGTYVRTLCHDIGLKLNTYGHMSFLMRVGVGNFDIKDSLTLDYLRSLEYEDLARVLIPMDRVLTDLEKIVVPDSLYNRLINGALLPMNNNGEFGLNKDIRVYSSSQFIGIGSIILKDNIEYLKMNKVLI